MQEQSEYHRSVPKMSWKPTIQLNQQKTQQLEHSRAQAVNLSTQSLFFLFFLFFPGALLVCPGAAPVARCAHAGAARAGALASSAQPGHVGFGGFWEWLLSVSVPCGFTPRPHKFTLNFRFKWMQNHNSQNHCLMWDNQAWLCNKWF